MPSNNDNIPSIEPVFILCRDIPHAVDEIRPLEMCESMAAVIGPRMVLGAQRINGLWRLYTKTKESRVDLTIKGIFINGVHLKPYSQNPFVVNANDPGEKREKIVIKNLPLSVDKNVVLDYLRNHPGLCLTSDLKLAHERNEDGSLTNYLNGDRYIYAAAPISPLLPATTTLGNFKVRIWHVSQQNSCKVCGQTGHRSKTESCPAFSPEEDTVAFRGHLNPLSNFYQCKVKLDDMEFQSAEHAFQWTKAQDLQEYSTAEEIYNARHAGAAKAISRDLNEKDVEEWSEHRGQQVMRQVLEAKMASNKVFYDAVLSTGSSTIAEATSDKLWACGLPPDTAVVTKPSFFPGKNKLGLLMMEIRNEEQLHVEKYGCISEKYRNAIYQEHEFFHSVCNYDPLNLLRRNLSSNQSHPEPVVCDANGSGSTSSPQVVNNTATETNTVLNSGNTVKNMSDVATKSAQINEDKINPTVQSNTEPARDTEKEMQSLQNSEASSATVSSAINDKSMRRSRSATRVGALVRSDSLNKKQPPITSFASPGRVKRATTSPLENPEKSRRKTDSGEKPTDSDQPAESCSNGEQIEERMLPKPP